MSQGRRSHWYKAVGLAMLRFRRTLWLLLAYFSLASLVTALGCSERQQTRFRPNTDAPTCEPAEPGKDLCPFSSSGSWNTSYPNVFNHTSHKMAYQFLNLHRNLFLQEPCSEHLSHFLCYAVFPLCYSGFHRVEPCQEMCVAVRENCTPELVKNGMEWPQELDCNKFPTHGSSICVWNGNTNNCNTGTSKPPAAVISPSHASVKSPVTRKSLANCTGHLVPYPNRSHAQYGGINNCDERCHGVYLTPQEEDFNTVWIAIWSLPCLLVSIITILTWVINYKAIKSPESLVYYISLCYSFIALSYTISIAVGEESIICDSAIKNSLNESALVVNGLHFPVCIALFSITYFFTLASWIWWALLNVEWLVCSVKSRTIGIKWRICSQLVGWGVPLVFLLIALGTESVGGNTFLRTCWIRKNREVVYVIAPLLTVIVFSCVVILIAFTRVTKLQRVFKDADLDREQVEHITTLIQVSLYCTVYLVPMGVLVCCYWYEYCFREQWEHSYINCLHNPSTCSSSVKPNFSIIKMKLTVSLIMGVLSGVWTFRKSSTRAWRKVCCICCSPGQQGSESELQTVRQIKFTDDPLTARFSFSETSV